MLTPEVVRNHSKIILFDGVCNLCSAWVVFVSCRDASGNIKFASVQSDIGKTMLNWCGLPTDYYETMVYVEHGKAYFRSAAFLKVVRSLSFPWPLLSLARWIPPVMRDWIYDRIALNRYTLFGKKDRCFTPSKDVTGRFL